MFFLFGNHRDYIRIESMEKLDAIEDTAIFYNGESLVMNIKTIQVSLRAIFQKWLTESAQENAFAHNENVGIPELVCNLGSLFYRIPNAKSGIVFGNVVFYKHYANLQKILCDKAF